MLGGGGAGVVWLVGPAGAGSQARGRCGRKRVDPMNDPMNNPVLLIVGGWSTRDFVFP